MKKIIKCLSMAVFALVVAFGSFFIPKYYNKMSLVAKADNTTSNYSFTGSSWLTFMVYDNSKYSIVNTRCNLSTISNTIIDFYGIGYLINYSSVASYSSYNYYYTGYWDSNYSYHSSSLSSSISYNFSNGSLAYLRLGDSSGSRVLVVRVSCDSSFNSNVYKIVVSSEIVSDSYSHFGQSFDRWLVVSYYDSNDYVCSYSLPTISGYTSNFNDRTYYIIDSSDFTDLQQYNQGYQQGLIDNQQSIYDNGYNAGNSFGYNNGYSAGVASANNYSFIGLIGAVVDVPVKTFMGLFNFNFLGINLATFFLGLITFAVIIFIIKIILGGK